MKSNLSALVFLIGGFLSFQSSAQQNNTETKIKKMYIDVHLLEPGKVKFDDLAGAHLKDLAVQGKHGVNFLKYRGDEDQGGVYYLSESKNVESVVKTHKEVHGLVTNEIKKIKQGQ